MDPYQSNTGGLLDLLSNYGTTTTSTDLLNLLSGWPGPNDTTTQGGGTVQPNPNGPVPNPDYDPSTQQDIQQNPSMGGGTPPPPPVGDPGSQQQYGTAGIQAPGAGTQGGQGQDPPQGQDGGTSLSINPLQIVGIAAVAVAVYLVAKKR